MSRDKSHDVSHEPLDWPECEEKVEAFKKRHIYQSIIDSEIGDMSYPHTVHKRLMSNV